MKLASTSAENMRAMSNIWAPPVYRRLVSSDKRERDMSERCLQKVLSEICPPPVILSKVAHTILFLYFLLTLISFCLLCSSRRQKMCIYTDYCIIYFNLISGTKI